MEPETTPSTSTDWSPWPGLFMTYSIWLKGAVAQPLAATFGQPLLAVPLVPSLAFMLPLALT